VLGLAQKLGLPHVCADVDTSDYSDLPQHDAEFVTDAVQPAETAQIVLLHDGNGDELKRPPRALPVARTAPGAAGPPRLNPV
jgi:hypothetical protein